MLDGRQPIIGSSCFFSFLLFYYVIYMLLVSFNEKIGRNGRPEAVDHFGQKVSVLGEKKNYLGFYFVFFTLFLVNVIFVLFGFCTHEERTSKAIR